MKHCAVCQVRATALTSPLELLGGIALLPLPAALGHGWPQHAAPMPSAQQAAARMGWAPRLRSRAAVAGGVATLLLFGGGLALLHNARQPAAEGTKPRPAVTLTPAADVVGTSTPLPTPSPLSTPSATTSAVQQWAAAQALMRNAHGYHVHYGSTYVYPAGGPPGSPLTFDLTVQPNGDYNGTYYAIDGYIGQFDIRRVGGIISVRNLDLAGNFGIAGAPPDTYQFFGLTSQQAQALGSSWLPLTGPAQQHAGAVLSAALSTYTDAVRLADTVLAPPSVIDSVSTGIEAGSTWLQAGATHLTYRLAPDAFIDYATADVTVHIDTIATT